MIETMVALMILVIIASAIIALILAVTSANNSAKLKNQAIGFGEEAIEQTRSLYQTVGFAQLYSKGSGGSGSCYQDGNLSTTALLPCPPVNPLPPNCVSGVPVGLGTFSRYMQVIQVSSSQVKIAVIVSWPDKSKCQTNEIDTIFYSY